METTTADYATGDRLRAWSRIWRYAVIVLGSGLTWAASAISLALSARNHDLSSGELRPKVTLLGVDACICVLAICLMPLRRKAPTAIALITAAVMVVAPHAAFGPTQLAATSNATHRRPVPIVLNVLVAAAASLVANAVQDSENGPALNVPNVVLAVLFLVPAVLLGLFVGARRDLIRVLKMQAEEEARKSELRVLAAQAEERTRIAREMHDVLAHRISLVAMHSGALTYRKDLPREEQDRLLNLIREDSSIALEELRQILWALRGSGDGVEPPQPTLETLPQLIDEVQEAGCRLDVTDEVIASGRAASIPALVSRTAYRVVQEALTNVRKHAPGAFVSVSLTGSPGGLLRIEIRNGVPTDQQKIGSQHGHGLGLTGLAERVELADGSLEYGPDGKGGFAVRAWLPWEGTDEDE